MNFNINNIKPGEKYDIRINSSHEILHKLSEILNINGANNRNLSELKDINHTQSFLLITTNEENANYVKNCLNFFCKNLHIVHLQDYEILPYDFCRPSSNAISNRIQALSEILASPNLILIVSAQVLIRYLADKRFIQANFLKIKIGNQLIINTFKEQALNNGYKLVEFVENFGEIAVRGSVIDIYAHASKYPYRINIAYDKIESIRTFNIDTQKSIKNIDEIALLAAHEFPIDDTSIALFKEKFVENFGHAACQTSQIYRSILSSKTSIGLEQYMPLFVEQTCTVFELFQNEPIVIQLGNINKSIDIFEQNVLERYEMYINNSYHPILKPDKLYINKNKIFDLLGKFKRITAKNFEINYGEKIAANLILPINADSKLSTIKSLISKKQEKVVIMAHSPSRASLVQESLTKDNLECQIFDSYADLINSNNTLGVIISPMIESFRVSEPQKINFIIDTEILEKKFLHPIKQTQYNAYDEYDKKFQNNLTPDIEPNGYILNNLKNIEIGSIIVHKTHGIGRYLGLESLELNDALNEYIKIEYADNDLIYLPIGSLNLITQYDGINQDAIQLSKLNSENWNKAKKKAAIQITDIATKLLELQSARATKKGFIYKKPDEEYTKFINYFPFNETADQLRAINDIIDDMTSDRIMDRLICGDVGFGKTEIAMRAAFMAVASNKQVAVLVPTTLLAEQHYRNFKDRFINFAVNIECISRFSIAKEQEQILKKLSEGKIDIIIGTHRIIQKDVKFKDLGLIIIDEEHRFGVKQKEELKKIRLNADVLAMTATPIPRTLYMSMLKIRDLSILTMPPAKRLSVQTFVLEKNDNLIKEAITRELFRNGQVYYLHNSVETIEKVKDYLENLVKEARVCIAHGQMSEKKLEQIMQDFYDKRFNVLVCTTIIESGIDIPTANTIIIDRADKFGLAQLHQLRGRVGRSDHQAYAYCIIPNKELISKEAKKRMSAFENLKNLGACFNLAIHDLEIRGAGEILGEEQSGNIQNIGYSMYMELLEKTINSIKKGDIKIEDIIKEQAQEIEINISTPLILPNSYVHDPHERLILYKRIADAKNDTDINYLEAEITDRFGKMPIEAQNLITSEKLKRKAEFIGVKRIVYKNNLGYIEFNKNNRINLAYILDMIRKQPLKYKLDGEYKLKFTRRENDKENLLFDIRRMLEEIAMNVL